MSWPSDGGPRYVVGSVTGYAITGAAVNGDVSPWGTRGGSSKAATVYTISDRANCHRTVETISERGRRGYRGLTAEQLARKRCAQMNFWDAKYACS